MVEDHEEMHNQEDILNVPATATSYKLNNDPPDTAGGQSTSPSLSSGYDQKSSTMFPTSPVADDTSIISEDSTDSSFHRRPQSSSQNVPEISAHILPQKSSPEALGTTDHHTLSNFKPSLDAAQNSHVSPPSANIPSVKMSVKTGSTQMSSRNDPLSNHSSNTNHMQHASHLNELTMDNSHRTRFQNDQFTNKNSVTREPHKEYDYRTSPQEESWVKQLFVARDKSIAQGEGHHRGLQNDEIFDKKHFTSNTAKFTTMVEEPSAGITKSPGHERPKAGLY